MSEEDGRYVQSCPGRVSATRDDDVLDHSKDRNTVDAQFRWRFQPKEGDRGVAGFAKRGAGAKVDPAECEAGMLLIYQGNALIDVSSRNWPWFVDGPAQTIEH